MSEVVQNERNDSGSVVAPPRTFEEYMAMNSLVGIIILLDVIKTINHCNNASVIESLCVCRSLSLTNVTTDRLA